ncbi:hypothetical protein CPZ87_09945 [Piscinibacter gummiphilus]|nr:hypothetical protein CPZ87_09945 [Piscinibacter gummiphilus]
MIGRSVSISSTMKSKNAATRGVWRNAGVVSTRQVRVSSETGSITRTRSGSASPRATGNGATPRPARADWTRPSTLLFLATIAASGAIRCSHTERRCVGIVSSKPISAWFARSSMALGRPWRAM